MMTSLESAAARLVERRGSRRATAVQVGAYDGSSNDPLAGVLRRHGWRGVLVEPQPAPFAKLARLHAGNPDVLVFNVAIADRDGRRELYTVETGDGLPDGFAQAASFSRAQVERVQRYAPAGIDVRARVRAVEVETWTFDTLVRRAGVEEVDVLQLDAEGYDLELLRLFDLSRRRPEVVHYEHFNLGEADQRAAVDLLIENGYEVAPSSQGWDTVAWRAAGGPAAGTEARV